MLVILVYVIFVGRVPRGCSGLRIWPCHCCGLGHCCDSGSVPGLGTPTCCRLGEKREKKKLLVTILATLLTLKQGKFGIK